MDDRFHHLLDRCQHRAWQLATLILGGSGEAEEVVQDALIKLWQRLPALDPGREPAWLMACVRNACLDRQRNANRHRHLLGRIPPANWAPSAEFEALASERQRRLAAAIARLAEPARSLIILRDVQEMDSASVGRILGLSAEQVKVYAFRARRQLRQMLEEAIDEQAA